MSAKTIFSYDDRPSGSRISVTVSETAIQIEIPRATFGAVVRLVWPLSGVFLIVLGSSAAAVLYLSHMRFPFEHVSVFRLLISAICLALGVPVALWVALRKVTLRIDASGLRCMSRTPWSVRQEIVIDRHELSAAQVVTVVRRAKNAPLGEIKTEQELQIRTSDNRTVAINLGLSGPDLSWVAYHINSYLKTLHESPASRTTPAQDRG